MWDMSTPDGHESGGRGQRGQALAEQPLKIYHPIPAQPRLLCYLGSEIKNEKRNSMLN